jgi:hypothetical protein
MSVGEVLFDNELIWWCDVKEEEMVRGKQERNEELRKLAMELLAFEASLARKQREIGNPILTYIIFIF